VTERRGEICNQLFDDIQEKTGYCKLTEEGLDRTACRSGFGSGCGPVVRQTAE